LVERRTVAAHLLKARMRTKPSKKPWLFALLAMLLVLACEQVIENFARHSDLEEEKNAVNNTLSTLRARLEGVVNSNLLLVHGLTAVIAAQPDIDQAGFARISRGLVDSRHALRNIAGAPDMVISLMYPLAGNEAALGLNYLKHPTQAATARQVMTSGQPLVAGPLRLQQGGIGIIVREPVFVPAEQPGGKPRFWGLISAVIDVDLLYQQAGLGEDHGNLRLAMRGTAGTGGRRAGVLWRCACFCQRPGDPQHQYSRRLLAVGRGSCCGMGQNEPDAVADSPAWLVCRIHRRRAGFLPGEQPSGACQQRGSFAHLVDYPARPGLVERCQWRLSGVQCPL
jgi:sensor domain CHASE-containing protein